VRVGPTAAGHAERARGRRSRMGWLRRRSRHARVIVRQRVAQAGGRSLRTSNTTVLEDVRGRRCSVLHISNPAVARCIYAQACTSALRGSSCATMRSGCPAIVCDRARQPTEAGAG